MAPLLDISQEHRVALLSPEERAEVLDGVDMDDLAYDWLWNGRPSQILPVLPEDGGVDWNMALALAGRGWGKTLCGAQWIRATDAAWSKLGQDTGHLRVALLGRTSADVRDTMLEGPSGLLNVYPPSVRDRVVWTPSRRRVQLPHGGVVTCFSAEEPSQLRGPAFHRAWADEIATYKQVRSPEDDATAWENLRIAVRLGERPQVLATTTPKRVPLVRQLLAEAARSPQKYLVRRGRTYDNKYLSEAYLDVLTGLYGGTSLGRQELEGEMLDDVAGAMTSEAIIEANRVTHLPPNIPWIKLVSVDPSVAERPNDECGIMVVYISRTWPVLKRHAFLVDDLSLRASPTVWAERAVRAAYEHQATIIAETNQGANLVFQMLRMTSNKLGLPMPPMKEVWATKAKAVRAEPVGGAYSQGRVHHVNVLADYESQATSWTAGDGYSPDRMDAAVQGIASGLFPEALTGGGLGAATLHSVANQHIPIIRQTALARRPGYGRGVA
jgi:phage terminase large subunit-like protein